MATDSPPARANSGGLADASLLVAIVLLGACTPIFAKDALDEMPPLATGFFRFAFASLLLSATVAFGGLSRGVKPAKIDRGDWPRFIFAAVLCVPINQASFLGGVKLANASHAGLLYALAPVIIYVLTLAIGRTQLSLRMASATVLAFVGAAVVGIDGVKAIEGLGFFFGDVLLFVAVLSWSAYTVVVIPLAKRYGPVRTLATIMLIGTVMYTPVLWLEGSPLDFTALSRRALIGFLYITVFTSYFSYILWFTGVNRMDINRLAVASNAAPILAVIAAYLWRGEPITWLLFVGAALIVTAITLANWDKVQALRRAKHVSRVVRE